VGWDVEQLSSTRHFPFARGSRRRVYADDLAGVGAARSRLSMP
jgi:hypothetical protein